MKLELIKQNVNWCIANSFRMKTDNVCLRSLLSSRSSASHPAFWKYSLWFLWSESDCPLGWGSRLYSFRVMPCLSDNYTIYCLSWSGCDIIAGYVFKMQSKCISTVTFSGSVCMLVLILMKEMSLKCLNSSIIWIGKQFPFFHLLRESGVSEGTDVS